MPTYSFNRAHAVITDSDTTILTVPASHKYILTGIRIANVTTSSTTFNLWVDISASVRRLVGLNWTLVGSGALEVVEGSKIILVAGDVLKGLAGATNSISAFVSYLDEDNS